MFMGLVGWTSSDEFTNGQAMLEVESRDACRACVASISSRGLVRLVIAVSSTLIDLVQVLLQPFIALCQCFRRSQR